MTLTKRSAIVGLVLLMVSIAVDAQTSRAGQAEDHLTATGGHMCRLVDLSRGDVLDGKLEHREHQRAEGGERQP